MKALETKIIISIISVFIAVVIIIVIFGYIIQSDVGVNFCLYLTNKVPLLDKLFNCYEYLNLGVA